MMDHYTTGLRLALNAVALVFDGTVSRQYQAIFFAAGKRARQTRTVIDSFATVLLIVLSGIWGNSEQQQQQQQRNP